MRHAMTTHSEIVETQRGSFVFWQKVKSRHRNGEGLWKKRSEVPGIPEKRLLCSVCKLAKEKKHSV